MVFHMFVIVVAYALISETVSERDEGGQQIK